ncbi:MAG: cell division protein FtsH, partial [Firmicutes bacterium]|nr:cell division protein FtsH [Bacillota bacterium]
DRVVAGLERKAKIITGHEKKIIATHESGHALATYLLKNETIHRISILPRGKAMGFVMQTSENDKSVYHRRDLLNKIMTLLGGRAAEELEFGDISSGGKNDLEKATEIALSMVGELGMSSLGQISYAGLLSSSFVFPAELYDKAKDIIEECYHQIKAMLEDHRQMLSCLADSLMARETLSGDEVKQMLVAFESH